MESPLVNEKAILEKKGELEKKLKQLVSEFETETGLLIDDINLVRGQAMQDRQPHTSAVSVDASFKV